MIVERARAKLNLALHVTGRRADGYHLLDSLVAFAALGDTVALQPGPLSLTVEGPFAGALAAEGEDNLCLRAARAIGGAARIRLTKVLPVASGIGGGSADAAAVLRGFHRMGLPLPSAPERLGADVPVCLAGQPARMRGVGERLDPVPALPALPVVLVNPGIALATPAVFAALQSRENPVLPEPSWRDAAGFLDYLGACRNDLEPPARGLAPVIGRVLQALRAQDALLARMSGSGATCFGIFARPERAAAAAAALAREGWWAVASELETPAAAG